MNTELFAGLTGNELQQLGMNASSAGDAGAALAYLKEAARRADANAGTHFLLGCEYAQNRLYPAAVDAMEAAVALDPSLAIARFQLGLLLVTMQDSARAQTVLEHLDEVGADDSLYHFGQGLRYLISDEIGSAMAALRTGLKCSPDNPAIVHDMEMLLAALDELPAQEASPEAAGEESGWHHMLISTYTGQSKT
jgi:tetratricopeptide (TPR) repeat protein